MLGDRLLMLAELIAMEDGVSPHGTTWRQVVPCG